MKWTNGKVYGASRDGDGDSAGAGGIVGGGGGAAAAAAGGGATTEAVSVGPAPGLGLERPCSICMVQETPPMLEMPVSMDGICAGCGAIHCVMCEGEIITGRIVECQYATGRFEQRKKSSSADC